jgi:hypothetical protein
MVHKKEFHSFTKLDQPKSNNLNNFCTTSTCSFHLYCKIFEHKDL